MNKKDVILEIKKYFDYLDFDVNDIRGVIEPLIDHTEFTFYRDISDAFKLELTNNLLPFNKEIQVKHLNNYLSYAPKYLKNELLAEQKETLIEYLNNSQLKHKDLQSKYIVFTYKIWEEVLHTIMTFCENYNIEYEK